MFNEIYQNLVEVFLHEKKINFVNITKYLSGGVAEKSDKVSAGDEIIRINNHSVERMTRIEVWNLMKRLPNGPVRLLIK